MAGHQVNKGFRHLRGQTPVSYTYLGGLHGGGGSRAHLGHEGRWEVDRWRGGEGRTRINTLKLE